jgi:hypothetical protein
MLRTLDGRRVEFFSLLWCEACGHASEPPRMESFPSFVGGTGHPLTCIDCGEPLTMIEAHVTGDALIGGRWVATMNGVEAVSRAR